MNRASFFLHPVFVLILSIIALVTSLFLYIYWYIEASVMLNAIVTRFNIDTTQVLSAQTWVVVMVLSILVGLILIGIFTIFVYNIKTLQLYRLQNNFINNFTHELKTPVTSLKLYLETFLKYDFSTADREKYIHYMISDVGRLSENIHRILNLAGIESKTYKGDFVKVNLYTVIRDFLSQHERLFRHCTVKLHPPGDRDFMYAVDLSLFEMLLMNLMTNAVKYNQSSTPAVDIDFSLKNNKLILSFKDNGIGIEKKKLKKIFKKFYQIGRSDDMSAVGSGLGLYLVQSIAKMHKGKVVAESKGQETGAQFMLILPYKTS